MTRYRLSAAAIRDLDEIADYIMVDNPRRALSFVDEVIAKFTTIADRPFSFPQSSDLPVGLRSALHGHYRIIFAVDGDFANIVRIVHGARHLPSLLGDEQP